VKENRGEGTGAARVACEHRSRSIEESLAEFEKMKRGEYISKMATHRCGIFLHTGWWIIHITEQETSGKCTQHTILLIA
jgi:hypothetical protein